MQLINSHQKAQQGFTLIELVVVIVILGILAVTAAPKFIDLQSDARFATLQAVEASVKSAATMVHSKALIAGRDNSTGAESVSVNGVPVAVRFGYPRDNNEAARLNWQNDLLDLNVNDFTVSRQNGAIIIFPTATPLSGTWPVDMTNPVDGERNCYVRYQESDVAGDPPSIIDTAPCL